MRSLLALIRASNWWHSKIPPLLAVAFVMVGVTSAAPAQGYVTMAAALTSLCAVAAYGHVVNDLCDVDADASAGKPNAMAGRGPIARLVATALPLLLAVVPLALIPVSTLALAILVANIVVPTIYSAPPIRLKERHLWGVVADAAGAHVLPTWFIIAVFLSRDTLTPAPMLWVVVAATLWTLAVGLRGIVNHMLDDLERDQRAGVSTWVHGLAGRRVTFVSRGLLVIELPALAGLLLLIYPSLPAALWVLALFSGLELLKVAAGWRAPSSTHARGVRPYQPFSNNTFHELWLPASLAIDLARADPAYVALPVAFLACFWRNAVVEWATVARLTSDLRAHAADLRVYARGAWYRARWQLELDTQNGSTARLGTIRWRWRGVRVTPSGRLEHPWDIKLFRSGIRVAEGTRYRLVFEAGAGDPRPLTCGVAQAHRPWKQVGLQDTVTLRPTWQRFSHDFVATADEPDACIFFWLGHGRPAVELTGIQLSVTVRDTPPPS